MRMRLIPEQLYDRILSHLERLKSIEQRRQTASFGGRRQHDDDNFSIHPRTLAELKRRDHNSAG